MKATGGCGLLHMLPGQSSDHREAGLPLKFSIGAVLPRICVSDDGKSSRNWYLYVAAMRQTTCYIE